jgi:dTDP-4-amino-4,6-dideoxygalactose transaminase
MMGLDLKPGDEVITADFTFAATVEVIALLQLTFLVDVDLYNMNISIDGIQSHNSKNKSDCTGSLVWTCSQYGAVMLCQRT